MTDEEFDRDKVVADIETAYGALFMVLLAPFAVMLGLAVVYVLYVVWLVIA